MLQRGAWKGLPEDLKEIVARNLNAAALRERDDMRQGRASVQADLEKAGLAFNTAETQSFRDGLKKAGSTRTGATSWATSRGRYWRNTPASSAEYRSGVHAGDHAHAEPEPLRCPKLKV